MARIVEVPPEHVFVSRRSAEVYQPPLEWFNGKVWMLECADLGGVAIVKGSKELSTRLAQIRRAAEKQGLKLRSRISYEVNEVTIQAVKEETDNV
jgi:hypothetical protein